MFRTGFVPKYVLFSCENNDNTWSFRGGMGLSENISEISVNYHHLHRCQEIHMSCIFFILVGLVPIASQITVL